MARQPRDRPPDLTRSGVGAVAADSAGHLESIPFAQQQATVQAAVDVRARASFVLALAMADLSSAQARYKFGGGPFAWL